MQQENLLQKIIAFAIAAMGVIMFSAKAVFVKMAYAYDIDSVSLLLIRMGIALPIYIVIAVITSIRQKKQPLQKSEYYLLILLGFLGYYLASYFDFKGLQYISASLERLILFVYPTLVLIISSVFLKKRITLGQKLAIVVTYIGVLLAFYKYGTSTMQVTNIPLGATLIFLSAVTYAFFLVGSGSLIPKIGSVRFTSYAMIVSCLGVFLHFIIGHPTGLFKYPVEVYKLGLGMSIISTVIPSFLLGEAIRRLGAPNVAIIGSIGPISTIVLATLFLGETITRYQFAGTIIVIAGVTLLGIIKENPKAAFARVRSHISNNPGTKP